MNIVLATMKRHCGESSFNVASVIENNANGEKLAKISKTVNFIRFGEDIVKFKKI